jgi:hypothetical protein
VRDWFVCSRVGSKSVVDGKGNNMLGSFEVGDGFWENVNEIVNEIVDISGFNGIGACRHFEGWADSLRENMYGIPW